MGAILAPLLWPQPLRAELSDDAARLMSAWGAHGTVKRLAPRFAERGAASVIFLPPALVSASARVCTSVAILGPPSTHFTVRAVGRGVTDGEPSGGDDEPPSELWPEPSLAGLVQLTRCGQRRPRLAAVVVELRSPRAVLETIVVETQNPLVSAVEVLPHRNPGPIEPLEERSPRPAPLPLKERLQSAEARVRREGARHIAIEALKSNRAGSGQYRGQLSEGCHRLTFLTEPSSPGEPEHELALVPTKSDALSVVALENGDGSDASLTLCAGERTALEIGFSGAASSSLVHTVAAEWPLPRGLPESWGSRARARVAATLFKHHARIDGAPIDQALGIQGPTLMPLPVEPGACYVGVLVAMRGTPHALTLSGTVGHDLAHNHAGPGGDGTLISLCARSRSHALFEADARGPSLFWLFALFQNGRIPVGGERD